MKLTHLQSAVTETLVNGATVYLHVLSLLVLLLILVLHEPRHQTAAPAPAGGNGPC